MNRYGAAPENLAEDGPALGTSGWRLSLPAIRNWDEPGSFVRPTDVESLLAQEAPSDRHLPEKIV